MESGMTGAPAMGQNPAAQDLIALFLQFRTAPRMKL